MTAVRDIVGPRLARSEIQTIWAAVRRAAHRWPNRRAIRSVPDGTDLTFHGLKTGAEAVAGVLVDAGVGPGDHVGLMMVNRIEYPLAWLACARLGAVAVPINNNYGKIDAGYVIDHSEVCVVIVDGPCVGLVRSLANGRPDALIVLDVDDWPIAKGPLPMAPVGSETLVNIQYTSGTTGSPKGCLLSHNYWLTQALKNVVETPGIDESDVLLTAQPFSYMDPQWNLMAALVAGAELVVLDRFHPSTFFQAICEYGVTTFYCLGVMPSLLLKMTPSRYDRHHRLRVVTCSSIPIDRHAELEQRFGVPWLETYGMTEIGNGAAMTLEQHHGRVGTGAIGQATGHREIRVVDSNGVTVPRGTSGELIVRGVGLMDGYFKDSNATGNVFRNGWFHTGDRAHIDEEGFLFFEHRETESIRRSGENISAAEVERAILTHPAVTLAACVAVPDELRGAEVKACVVLDRGHRGADVLERQVPDHCEGLLAYFKVPRYWEYRESLPMTLSEKISRRELVGLGPFPVWDRADEVWR